jgi:hypothetical protein
MIAAFPNSPFNFAPPLGGDPYFSQVALLLHFDGTNGSTTFTDNSPSPKTATAAGNAQLSTASPKFGTAALLCDGVGDSIAFASNADFNFTGDFTVEFWLKWSSLTGYQTIYDRGYIGTGGLLLQTGVGTGRLIVYANGSIIGSESDALGTGVWGFYQLVRSGSTIKLNRDGVEKLSATNSANFTNSSHLCFGSRFTTNGFSFNGQYDDIRITNGFARPNVVPPMPFSDS